MMIWMCVGGGCWMVVAAYLLRQRFVVCYCGVGQLDDAAVAGDAVAAVVDSVRLNCNRIEMMIR